MTAMELLLQQLMQFRDEVAIILDDSKCTKRDSFFKQICLAFQGCDSGKEIPIDLLSDLQRLVLSLLSKRILYLDQQLIASKAFLCFYTHNCNKPEHLIKFFTQLSLLDERNLELVCESHSQPALRVNFSNNEEISLFKLCFYYHFSNSFKDKTLFSLFCSTPESTSLLNQVIFFCKTQSYLTSLAFKTLVNFLLNFSQPENHEFFSKDLIESILNLCLANWENSIPGVKESNLIIFRQFLVLKKHRISNLDLFSIVLKDLSWSMKSKYLMLMEILKLNEDSVKTLNEDHPSLIMKLFESMKINYLVSPCSELYSFIIGCIDFEKWKEMFFKTLIETLASDLNNESQKVNILNHWMLETWKKFPKSLEDVLSGLCEEKIGKQADCRHLAIIMCLKILRKQGLKGYKEYDDFQKWEPIILEGLQHINERIRCETFNLVCSCTITTVEPSRKEFDAVLQFIIENVNYDSSYVRQSLLTSFIIFLERVKRSNIKKSGKTKVGSDSNHQNDNNWFFKLMTAFLSQNLDKGSNYQRRITSLKLMKIILEFGFSHESFKSIREYFLDDEVLERLYRCIAEEKDDVNEAAAQIIIIFFRNGVEISNNYTLSDCLTRINSEPMSLSARNEILLKVCLVKEVRKIESNSQSNFISNEILVPLLRSIQQQETILSKDTFRAASSGALCSSLKALTCLISSKETSVFISFDPEFWGNLITAIELIVHHLLMSLTSGQNGVIEFAPSFAEMASALKNQIQNSMYCSEDKEETEGVLLSPAYQLLLCSIWRNLQACCDLSVNIVTAFGHVMEVEEVLRCGKLLSNILTQCRHKGAIEAAGVALGRLVSFVIKLNNKHYTNWIDELLSKLFEMLTSKSSKTISRRSAGLSIFAHRLAVSDTRYYNSVVVKIVPMLLNIAEVPFVENNLILKDVSQAQALHLLCKIVEDSSLKLSVTPFLQRIVVILCSSIASPVWCIRNAALQLCGAVTLKILGRNKTQETDCLVNTTYEQLFSHHEYLANILARSFANPADTDANEIIFLLTLLSYTSIQTDADPMKTKEQQQFLVRLRELVHQFLSHKNYEIRRLAAVSYVNLFPMSKYVSIAADAVKTIHLSLKMDSKLAINKPLGAGNTHQLKRGDETHDENLVHGCLLVIEFAVKKFKKEDEFSLHKFSFFSSICRLASTDSDLSLLFDSLGLCAPPTLSFIVKSLIREICYQLNFSCCKLKRTDQFLEADIRAFTKFVNAHDSNELKNFGVVGFSEILLKCLIARHECQHMGNIFWFCSMNYSHTLLNVCLQEMRLDSESAADLLTRCFKFLSVGFFADDPESRVISLTVMESIISIFNDHKRSLRCLTDISLEDIENFSGTFIQDDSEFTHKAILIVSGILYHSFNTINDDDKKRQLLRWKIYSRLIKLLPEKMNTNFERNRLCIAKSLYFLSKMVERADESNCRIWEAIVYLLQDEEFIIRQEVSELVSEIANKDFVLNPFVALMEVASPKIMLKMMEPYLVVKCFCDQYLLIDTVHEEGKPAYDLGINRPRGYTYGNFYVERLVILKIIATNLCLFINISVNMKMNLVTGCLKEAWNRFLRDAERGEFDRKFRVINGSDSESGEPLYPTIAPHLISDLLEMLQWLSKFEVNKEVLEKVMTVNLGRNHLDRIWESLKEENSELKQSAWFGFMQLCSIFRWPLWEFSEDFKSRYNIQQEQSVVLDDYCQDDT